MNTPPSELLARNNSYADSRISHPKYWLTAIAIQTLLFICYVYSSLIAIRQIAIITLCLFFLILVILHIKKLLNRNMDQISERDKWILIVVVALFSLLALPVYFLSLRKKKPAIALVSVKIGFKIIVLNALYSIAFIAVIFITGLGATTPWTQQESQQFNSYISTLENDTNTIYANVEAKNIAKTRIACDQLGNDVAKNKTLRPYPDHKIQAKLREGLSVISKASEDCIKGIDDGDTTAANQSTDEILSGFKSINSAIDEINKR